MVTNLHTVEVMETPNPITTVDTDKDIRLNMVEVRLNFSEPIVFPSFI